MSAPNKGSRGTSSDDEKKLEPIVCVVIPCHNHADFVQHAIQSVTQQDFPHLIVCVVNDGSADESQERICALFEQQINVPLDNMVGGLIDNRPVYVFHNEQPTGPGAARNVGIKFGWNMADLYGVLDADDQWLPGKLQKSVDAWIKDTDRIGMVYTDVLINNLHTGVIMHEFRQPFLRARLERENIISNSPLISKMALNEVGLYDEDLRTCEDWDLWLRITERFAAVHIPEALQVYTVTGFNATDIVKEERWRKDWQRVQQKLRERHGQQ